MFGTKVGNWKVTFLSNFGRCQCWSLFFLSGIVWWQEMFNIHSTLRDERVQQSGYEVGTKLKTCPNWRYPLEEVAFLRVVTAITWVLRIMCILCVFLQRIGLPESSQIHGSGVMLFRCLIFHPIRLNIHSFRDLHKPPIFVGNWRWDSF